MDQQTPVTPQPQPAKDGVTRQYAFGVIMALAVTASFIGGVFIGDLRRPSSKNPPTGTGQVYNKDAKADEALQDVNVEYAGKRRSDRLGPIRVNLVPPRFLADLDRRRAERYRRGNEQYKHQYLYTRPGDDAEFPGSSAATASNSPPALPVRPDAGQAR